MLVSEKKFQIRENELHNLLQQVTLFCKSPYSVVLKIFRHFAITSLFN